jgi:glucan phosphoethanolaminetransferase (alkaline phosphatase superfamily)
MLLLLKKYYLVILALVLSFATILINEETKQYLMVNNIYRVILTVGMFYLGVLIYRYLIGKILIYLLFAGLSINFFASLVARFAYNSRFDETQATSVLLTNSNEASGMLFGYISYVLITVLFFGLCVFVLKKLLPHREHSAKTVKYFVGATMLLYTVFVVEYVATKDVHKWDKSSSLAKFLNKTPLFNSARIVEALKFMEETKQITHTKVDYSDLIFSENNLENIVVILGESARRENLSLYKYPWKTTPYIDQRESNLLIYENAVAPAAYTILAVPLMLSKATPSDDYSPKIISDNVINIANHTQEWKTYWFSSQEKIGVHTNAISAIASQSKVNAWNPKGLDEELLPYFNESIADNSQKRLIFLHLNGSHYPFKSRYPKEFEVFDKHANPEFNEYNNSIYYTDFVIEQIIKKLENTRSIVIYVSDHGLSVSKNTYLHSFTKKGLDVPFFIWHSDLVSEDFKKTGRIKDEISTTELYEILKDYMGVKTSMAKERNWELKAFSGEKKISLYKDLKDGDLF